MTLKINYLDKKKGTSKNKAFFVGRANKIAEFKGEIDDKTFNDILKFKKDKSLKDNKIISKEDNWGTKKMLFQSKDNFGGILIKYPKKNKI